MKIIFALFGAADLELVWSSTLLAMSTKLSKLKEGHERKCFQLKTELYSQHYEKTYQCMVEKKKLEQKNLTSDALHNGSQDCGLSDDEQFMTSNNEATDGLGSVRL